jgi:hypothetical protein
VPSCTARLEDTKEWRLASTYSSQHLNDGQTASLPGQEPPIPTEQEAEWAPDSISNGVLKRKNYASAWHQTTDPSSSSQYPCHYSD